MIKQTNAQKQQIYRQKLREALGEDEYLKQQRLKKKAYRHKKQAIVDEDGDESTEQSKNCANFAKEITTTKNINLIDKGKLPIKETTMAANITTLERIHKDIFQKKLNCDNFDWLEDNYGIDRNKVLDPKQYRKWRDEVYPFGGPDTYIDYLLELGLLKK